MVDQLRREAAIKRINVSQAIEDIKVSTIISFLGPPQALVTFPPSFLCSCRHLEYNTTRPTRGKKTTNGGLIFSHYLLRIDSLLLHFVPLLPWKKTGFLFQIKGNSKFAPFCYCFDLPILPHSTADFNQNTAHFANKTPTISTFFLTEVHIWSWERGLLAGGISFPKVQPIQGEIFMQCSLNQNSHQEITKPQRFSTLIPPF